MTDQYDIVVAGGGTAGAFAAATAAREGMDTVLLERKSVAEAGHIACGDAIKGRSTFPDVIDRQRLREEAFTNQAISRPSNDWLPVAVDRAVSGERKGEITA